MQEKEFNLLDEGWIKVLTSDLDVQEVSLTDVLIHAHEYKGLAGDMATQDIAILRLLLACILTIFYRYDEAGTRAEIDEDWDQDDVLDRWKAYWDQGYFSEKAIHTYIASYKERFWLFHPQTPFYQVTDLKYGTDYGVPSLYGNIKSSNNKATKHHFSMQEGKELQYLSYAEAARWLLNLNGFGVNIKNDKNAPGTRNAAGVGRLGKLGLIYVDGKNLFQILMLNLTPVDENEDVWAPPRPIWEQPVRDRQSIEIAPPDNLPELYTLQSRRAMLKRENHKVVGMRVMNGDYYAYHNDFHEQMTIWKRDEDKKTKQVTYNPLQHDAEKQIWREFSTIFNTGSRTHTPGVVQWVHTVCNQLEVLQGMKVTFRTTGLVYADGMSYTLGDCLSDRMTLSAELLKNFSASWIQLITDEIEKCEQVRNQAIFPFVKRIQEIFDQDTGKGLLSQLSGRFYEEIDPLFRNWMADIHPGTDGMNQCMEQWEKTACRCAKQVIRAYIETMYRDLYTFRETDKGISSIPGAYNEYLRNVSRIYPKMMIDRGGEKE